MEPTLRVQLTRVRKIVIIIGLVMTAIGMFIWTREALALSRSSAAANNFVPGGIVNETSDAPIEQHVDIGRFKVPIGMFFAGTLIISFASNFNRKQSLALSVAVAPVAPVTYKPLVNVPEKHLTLERDRLTRLFAKSALLALGEDVAMNSVGSIGMLFIQLGGFDEIIRERGTQCGDQLLIESSQLLRRELGENEVACRIGAVEFAALIPNINSERGLQHHAERFARVLSNTQSVGGELFGIQANVDAVRIDSIDALHDIDSLHQNSDSCPLDVVEVRGQGVVFNPAFEESV